jgi:hypothetical protein
MSQPQHNQPPTEYYPERIQAYAAQAAAAPSTNVIYINNRVQVVYIYAHTMAVHINNKIKH